jgi:hypothetical protein
MSDAEVYQTAMDGYRAAILQEEAAFQTAKLTGDMGEQVRASQALASYRSAANEYHAMAVQHARSMQAAAKPDPYGLTAEEREVAKNSFGGVKQKGEYVDISDDEKYALYAKNKAKYRQQRASGDYRDDQGTITRG